MFSEKQKRVTWHIEKPLPLILNSSKKSRWRMIETATTKAKINSTQLHQRSAKYKNSGSLLQSSSKHLLDELITNFKTHCDRAYSIAAPKLWNKLP